MTENEIPTQTISLGFRISLIFNIILLAVLVVILFQLFYRPIQTLESAPVINTVTEVSTSTRTTVSTTSTKENVVYLPVYQRKNDISNDGWMAKQWNGVYSNPGREFFASNPPDPYLMDSTKCPKLNSDDPNSYAIFENDELSVHIPFNEKWGGDFKLTPYDYSSEGLTSGLLSTMGEGWNGEGCPNLIRIGVSVRWEPKQELNDFLSKLKAGDTYNETSGIRLVEISSLNNPLKKFTALEYGVSGLGWNNYVVFFGDKNVYIFNSEFTVGFDGLEDIASTIELK